MNVIENGILFDIEVFELFGKLNCEAFGYEVIRRGVC